MIRVCGKRICLYFTMGEKVNDENKNTDRGNALETDPAVFYSDFLGKCVSAVVQPGRYKNCRKYAGNGSIGSSGFRVHVTYVDDRISERSDAWIFTDHSYVFRGKKQEAAEKNFCSCDFTWCTDYVGFGADVDDFPASGAESAACAAGAV